MARSSHSVTCTPPDLTRLPDSLTEGAVLIAGLRERGLLKELGERLKIRRKGGYCGLDVWLMLLLYLSSGTSGLKPLWELVRSHVGQLAGLAGRRKLPSPASLSRALGSVETELLREQTAWLLTGISGVEEAMKHPRMLTYDCHGEGWQVFDFDPTVTTVHVRALPQGEGLPEAQRTAKDTVAPGHSGRKRGQAQYRSNVVQHAGSSAWVHSHLSKGNGDSYADFALATSAVLKLCARLGHPPERTLLRMDGEYGNVPRMTACRVQGLPFITRLTRPKLFEDTEVLKLLRAATWTKVEDSRAGPGRAAAELGVLTIPAGSSTRKPDGTRFEPITVRVVACSFEKKGKAKRGKNLDGRQVELFAVDLPADAWPASEAVTAYFGRTAQENRFAQEDAEVGLDHLASYSLPGQELVALVGYSLWNMRLAKGFELDRPPDLAPERRLRQTTVDESIPKDWPREQQLPELLDKLDWTLLLADRAGWSFSGGQLCCPDGRLMSLSTVISTKSTTSQERRSVVFIRRQKGCMECGERDTCFSSKREEAGKHIAFGVPAELADAIGRRLHALRQPRESIVPTPGAPGKLALRDSLFLPAEARRAHRAVFRDATLKVTIEQAEQHPHPRLLAENTARRQRRRQTWEEKVNKNALREGDHVHLHVQGRPELHRLIINKNGPKATREATV